jgi:hypothetical protein
VVQSLAVYSPLLHNGCSTFRGFLLEQSHDIGQDELIRAGIFDVWARVAWPYIFWSQWSCQPFSSKRIPPYKALLFPLRFHSGS